MAAPSLLEPEDERASRHLTDMADIILRARRVDIPHAFIGKLFSNVAAEDLATYEAKELAELAEAAWGFLQERQVGQPKVRIENRPSAAGGGLAQITVIEIVNDDMPFLLDSVLGELAEQGVEVRLVAHPIVAVERDGAGALCGFSRERGEGKTAGRESLVHIHVARIEDEARRAALSASLQGVLHEVRLSVQDWRPMLDRIQSATSALKANPPSLPVDEVAEAVQFLEWLAGNNFTFLGMRDYTVEPDGDVTPLYDTGLGILRERSVQVLRRDGEAVALTAEIRAFLKEPKPLIITKANVRSRVHRRIYMDYVGLKRFDAQGKVAGEIRIVGLFTSTAYTRSTASIPYLRRKVDAVARRAKFEPHSHSGKALLNVLESYPRDDLFQIDVETLFRFALTIMQLDERPRVRVLPRRDRFGRFVSVLVYVPRDRYGSNARSAIGALLAEAYRGRVSAFYPVFLEGPLVRVHFIIGLPTGASADPDRHTLEDAVGAVVRTWNDDLSDAFAHRSGGAAPLLARYANGFSAAYREAYSAATAVADIGVIENLTSDKPIDIDFYRSAGGSATFASLKVWSAGRTIPLSERVPVLENMGFKVVEERTYPIDLAGGETGEIWLHDMLLERDDGEPIELAPNAPRLKACFLAVLRGEAESDGFNALVLAAGLPWRDIALLRATARFLRQARIAYSQDYLWTTLRKYAAIASRINALFQIKFNPTLSVSAEERTKRIAAVASEIEAALANVASLDDDTILRRFANAVNCALRTNFFQAGDGAAHPPTIAVKYDSRKLDELPAPRPLYEIFVYSPRLEGVHLRFGKVARGGIRWSDRPQDFRTEVLGLVKAQQVKNAVIVPVGAKGGFVPKHLAAGAPRDVAQAEGIAVYKLFIDSLLDITDNLTPDGLVPPKDVVRHDGDDPYLVVAADKGTATFSDIANSISIDHGFWLDDAFASGGSAGYDHKGMGITARGAWEAVKRHFRETDVDISATPFTVAGVGDMSGDVFGNGMLRERTIRLVAAFDHRDIFLDPAPDAEKSFNERDRLFKLPRSSWQDYDKGILSQGGGIYSRSAKEIVLSQQAQDMLGLPANVTPPKLIKAILQMQVDLLWFGGIGTYVRATTEGDDAAGDRANDAVRITGADLRCKVVGEGANLGLTQRGRIEAALRGIRLNTDAIDNSAGVNTSDVEVNIKIALSVPVREGSLTLPARNIFLAAMTEEVGNLVLRNNYLQTLALSLAERRGLEELGFQQRLMQTLEARGELDRRIEFLPDDMELAERRRRAQPLTRPELAVLLAYAKLSLFSELLDSSVPDDPYLSRELGRYFPQKLSAEFPAAVEGHRLKREIIATHLANSMINRGGPALVVRMADQTGAAPASIAAAFTAVRDSFGMTALNTEIDALDGKISGKLQLELYAGVQDLLLDRLVWFLRQVDLKPGLAAIVVRYSEGIRAVAASLDEALPENAQAARRRHINELTSHSVPADLAQRLADLSALAAAPDMVLIASETNKPVADIAKTYFAAGSFFGLDRIREPARAIAAGDYFDRLALDRALDQIAEAERRITAQMLANGREGPAAVQAWLEPRADHVARVRAAVEDIAASPMTVSKLSVAASLVSDLVKH